MTEQSSQDSVRYVIQGKHVGGALPGTRGEMWRDVYIQDGSEVNGGVFGNNLITQGTVRVKGSVYVRGAINIGESADDAQPSDVIFDSVVSTADSILVADGFKGRVKFLADVYASNININQTFIRGNVYARKAIIRDSVILGGVFCTESLHLQNVVLATFRTGSVELRPEVILFFPFAIAEKPIIVRFSVRALSFVNLSLLAKGESTSSLDIVELDQEDVVELEERVNDQAIKLNALTLGPRILDLEELKQHFLNNKKYLELLSLEDHLDANLKREDIAFDLEQLEPILFNLLRHPPRQTMKRSVRVKDLDSRQYIKDWISNLTEHNTANSFDDK